MANKSITQLKKERDRLVKSASTAQTKAKLKQANAMERKRLEKEIVALKNPASTRAKRAFFDFTNKAARSTGNFLKARARILNENMDRQTREKELRMMKQTVKKQTIKKQGRKSSGKRKRKKKR